MDFPFLLTSVVCLNLGPRLSDQAWDELITTVATVTLHRSDSWTSLCSFHLSVLSSPPSQAFKALPKIAIMARKRSKAKAKAKSKVKGGDVARKAQALIGFHKFTDLPTELRLMIIEEALQEDQKARPPRVVLFDHHTYRISPFAEQSRGLSPMLFVNKQFRSAALKIYVMLNVIDLGIAWIGKYGDDESWYNEDGELQYSLDVAKMVDAAGNEGDEDYEGIKVCVEVFAPCFAPCLLQRFSQAG